MENCCTLDIGMVLELAQPAMTCLVTLNLSACDQLKDEHVQVSMVYEANIWPETIF